MGLQKPSFVLVVSWLLVVAMPRQLPVEHGHKLEARLDDGMGSLSNCWNALFELQSCTNEIITFFLNGESCIGPDCCQAIHTITHQCWPAMLTSVGFTAQEGDILRGYCDALSSPPDGPATSPPPMGLARGGGSLPFSSSLGPVAAGMKV